ncbi:MAG: hypothetical protein EOM24_36500, partial [Chloroflexia bacterium]|nr:hypothetical protein [Chloroflexia bacterium]
MPPERRLQEAVQTRVPHVLPDVDQERVASVALHHRLSAVPVVDRSARLLGVVPSDALMQIEDPAEGFLARVAMVNLFLVLFNMLPAFPMDGGR